MEIRMKELFFKVKDFVDRLPIPFIRTILLLILIPIAWALAGITIGKVTILAGLIGFVAGGFFWHGAIKKLRHWLGWF
jgi:hypothetical protein